MHALLEAPTEVIAILGSRIAVLPAPFPGAAEGTLIDYTAPPRYPGPPPHLHRGTAELFHVVSGVLRLEVDGRAQDVEAGRGVVVPAGVVHRFANPSPEPVRFLAHLGVRDFGAYFRRLAEMVAAAPSWPPADPRPVEALAEEYDTWSPAVRVPANP